jgi:Tfp pilus assembly protein PilO
MRPFLPIILVVIAIGVFYLYISPNYGEVRMLLNQRSEYTNALTNIEAVKELRDSLEANISNLSQSDVDRLEKAIPKNINTVKLTSDLDALAGKRDMSLRNVRVVEETADSGAVINTASKDPYRTTTMSFSVVGTYAAFSAFLKDVEKSLQVIDIRSVSMRKTSEASNLMQFDLVVQTYWIQ